MSSSSSVEEYRNAATQFLSNFMAKPATESNDNVDTTPTIDYDAPKRTNLPLPLLAQALDAELFESEWFVTGRVNPVYFADSFAFSDPDVKITGGIRGYADGVRRLFDPATARAEVLSTQVNTNVTNTITCIWRLSGKVNIGPSGLTIKPYIVETDFTIDPQTGLIVAQEDKFNLPQWDILLSALFPVLIGRVTAPPAPVPARRVPPPRMPSNLQWKQQKQQPGGASPFAAVQGILAGLTARKQ